MAIDTTNIARPGLISLPAANYELISDLNILQPHNYRDFVNKLGQQNFTTFLSTFGGMEKVEGREFFHFEDTGALMGSVTVKTAVSAPAVGATVTVAIETTDHWDAGTKSPIRVGETLRLSSNGVEGKVLTVNKSVDGAHTMTVRPLKSTVAFASAGSANLLVGEVIQLASNTEAGEASSNIDPQMPIDERITNTTTEIRDDWNATDRAEMEAVYYDYTNDGGFGSAGINRGKQGAYTYRGLVLANRRFLNNVDFKLMKGGVQTNTGLNAGTVGTKGLVPEIVARGNAVTYSLGSLGISKLHAITAQMDVYGNAQSAMWLMDIFQRQEFDDTLFAQYPAGAYVWGSGTASQNATVAYGFDAFKIDNYMLKLGKYAGFNTEVTHKRTPAVDQYRNFGIIIPEGEVTAKYGNGGGVQRGRLKNIQIMYQEPMGGGTIANGVKVWEYGAGAPENLTATMQHTVSMITYKGIRLAGAQQFFTVSGS